MTNYAIICNVQNVDFEQKKGDALRRPHQPKNNYQPERAFVSLMLYNKGRFSFQPFIQCRARKCNESRTFFQYDSLWRDAIHHELFASAHHLNDGADGYVFNVVHLL